MSVWHRGGLAAVIWLALCAPAFATSYYVDSSCANNGIGTTDACAGSPGAAGAYNSASGLQTAASAAVAGDTVYIKNGSGTYVFNNGSGYANGNAGLHVDHSGTSGNVITIRGYPGHNPVISGCVDGTTDIATCDHAAFSTNGNSYLHITGFAIRGMLDAFANIPASTANLPTGLTIDNMELTQGYSANGDGNWSTIFVLAYTGSQIDHNYMHDFKILTNGGTQSSAACIKAFSNLNSIYEYNTCDTSGAGSTAGDLKFAFDDKQDAEGSVWRYNYFIGKSASCFRFQNQTSAMTGIIGKANDQVYQNVCVQTDSVDDTRGVQFEAAPIDGLRVYNNTFDNFTYCLEEVSSRSGNADNVQYYNNACKVRNHNQQWYDACCTVGKPSGPADYNSYTSGTAYKMTATDYGTLAAYKAATTIDAGSQEVASGSFGFTTGGTDGTSYHLTGGSPLVNFGHTGGTSGGASIDGGAYVNSITCVGYTCSAATTTPSPPTHLRVVVASSRALFGWDALISETMTGFRLCLDGLTGTSCADVGLPAGQTLADTIGGCLTYETLVPSIAAGRHTFTVEAYNGASLSSPSAVLTVTAAWK